MSDSDVKAAVALFRSYGVDPERLSAAELHRAWRKLAWICHPDHGGSTALMSAVNAAFGILETSVITTTAPEEPTPTSPKASSPIHRDENIGLYTPPPPSRETVSASSRQPDWIKPAGARFPNSAGAIRRRDFTDRNYIRKVFYERSREPRTDFHVEAFDGVGFLGLILTMNASLREDAAAAVAHLYQAETGQPAPAILIRPRGSSDKTAWQVWVLRDRHVPVELEHQPLSVNDPAFLVSLTKIIKHARGTV